MKKKSLTFEVIWRLCVKLLCVLLLGQLWKHFSKDGGLYNFSDHILPVFAILFAAWAWLRYRMYDSTLWKRPNPYHASPSAGLVAIGMSEQLSKDTKLSSDLNRSIRDWNNDDILHCSRQWSDILCAVLCILPYLIRTFL